MSKGDKEAQGCSTCYRPQAASGDLRRVQAGRIPSACLSGLWGTSGRDPWEALLLAVPHDCRDVLRLKLGA